MNISTAIAIGTASMLAMSATAQEAKQDTIARQHVLDEVSIESQVPEAQMKGDAMVFQISNSPIKKAGTLEDLLDKLPQVTAKDGSVEVFGRGTAEIYINGRRIYDNTELKRILSENVASIKVINNPGARYAASTRAVIRIQTIKAFGDGFGFSNMADAGYRYDWSYGDQFDANYRVGGFDLTGRVGGHFTNTEGPQKSEQFNYIRNGNQTDVYEQRSDARTINETEAYDFMLQGNYNTQKGSSMGIRYEYGRTPSSSMSLNFPTHVLLNGQELEFLDSHTEGNNQITSHSTNLYYVGKIFGNWELSWNADGFWNENKGTTFSDEKVHITGQDPISVQVPAVSSNKNQFVATKAILEHPLWGGVASFGGEYSSNNRRNLYLSASSLTNSDRNKVHEQVISGFLEYKRRFGRFDTNLGLRYEHVESDYYQDGTLSNELSRSYTDLFPSASISTVLFNRVWTQLSYSNDISRPAYSYYTNSLVYLNRYTLSGGNANLQPTYQRNLTLNVAYKTMFLNLGYQRVQNAISILLLPQANNPQVCEQRPYNMDDYDHLYATFSYRPNINAWWHPMLAVNAGCQNFKAYDIEGRSTISMNRPLFNLIWQNNFNLPWQLMLDADATYISAGDQLNTRINQGILITSLKLQRDFLERKLNVSLDVTDPFSLQKIEAKVYSGANIAHTHNIAHWQAQLRVTYRFNRDRDKYRGTGAGAAMRSRM